jgi:hypothetical protein
MQITLALVQIPTFLSQPMSVGGLYCSILRGLQIVRYPRWLEFSIYCSGKVSACPGM